MKCEFMVISMFLMASYLLCRVHSLPVVVTAFQSADDQLVESSIEKNAVADQISEAQQFYEVDAFGDDFIDFGAETGPHGAYQWHANYPIHRSSHYEEEDHDHDDSE